MEKINGTPYENSRYFTRGDYTIHYRIDESHGERSGRASACFGEPGTGTGLCVMTAVCVPPDMEKAGKIPVPVLYIDADMDIFVTKKKREEFRKDLPDADKLTLRYGGHCMIQNRFPELMPEILYFLIKNGLIETTQVQ